MVVTRAQAKRLYNEPIIGYSYGKLDDGTDVLVEIISKNGETTSYDYNGGKFYRAQSFKIGQIKAVANRNKMMRFSHATIQITDSDIPSIFKTFIGKRIVYFGENKGPIMYYDRKR